MSIRPLILKDGVYTIPRSSTDISSLLVALGLGNVNNTSDSNKPVSTATQTALNLKANLVSPALTGTPTVPTATAGTNTTQAANTAFVSTAISNLISSSPATLDTLNELAAALGNDANFSTTITNSLANKVDFSTNQTIGGIKTFSSGLVLPSIIGDSIGRLWRNGDNLEYKDSANVSRVLLDNLGNLTNLGNRQTALNNLTGTQVANRVLKSDGTNTTFSQVNLANDTTGILPISLGGTGSTTLNFVNLTTTQTIAGEKIFSNRVRAFDLMLGNDPYINTANNIGKGYISSSPDYYEDYKLGTNGFLRMRCGAGAEFGYARQFMQVKGSNGDILFNSTTATTSTTTGSLVTGGGAAFGGAIAANLATSPTGLAAGTFWRNGNVVNIV